MKVIVGLGNPGRRYSKTRHNLGFTVLDKLAVTYGIELNKKKFNSLCGEGFIDGEKVMLAKPQTFMNLSGRSVAGILKGKKAEVSDLIIISDDMDLAHGKIRIRSRGSAGGHKGLKSIIDSIGTDSFIRIRMGIGRPENDEESEDYVLSPFRKTEAPVVADMVDASIHAVITIIRDGITSAMNRYNTRNPHFTLPSIPSHQGRGK